jgi:hypothetical protein
VFLLSVRQAGFLFQLFLPMLFPSWPRSRPTACADWTGVLLPSRKLVADDSGAGLAATIEIAEACRVPGCFQADRKQKEP